MGLWVGIGVGALIAAVGVDSWLRFRSQEQDTGSGASHPPVVAGAIDAGVPSIAAVPPPASPHDAGVELAQGTPDAADAGTAADAGALAAAPTESPDSESSAKHEEKHAATPAPAVGTLVIQATPYATVMVNGRSYGDITGKRYLKLPPGKYHVVFHHPTSTKTEDVTLAPNGTERVEFHPSR
jgi:serine/threonine-protein kinase